MKTQIGRSFQAKYGSGRRFHTAGCDVPRCLAARGALEAFLAVSSATAKNLQLHVDNDTLLITQVNTKHRRRGNQRRAIIAVTIAGYPEGDESHNWRDFTCFCGAESADKRDGTIFRSTFWCEGRASRHRVIHNCLSKGPHRL